MHFGSNGVLFFCYLSCPLTLSVRASMDYMAEITKGLFGMYACPSKQRIPYDQIEGVATPQLTSENARDMGTGPSFLDDSLL